MDLWHCNSTGVYSGVVASGNGDTSDTTNINAAFLRAFQPTDADGVAYFETIFPGHYTSRATHMHVLVSLDATLLANNTLDGGHVSHVGQAFFDQDLITAVEKLTLYSTNTQELTLNSADQILSEEAASMDPVVQYTLIGNSLSDGILAWITIGIDASAQYNVSSAATWTADGGVVNENAGAPGGGPGGPSANGTAPNGPFPSGAVPSGAIPSEAIPSDAPVPSDTVISFSTDLIVIPSTGATDIATSTVEPVSSSTEVGEIVISSMVEPVSSSSGAAPSLSSFRFITITSHPGRPTPSQSTGGQPGRRGAGNGGRPGQDRPSPGGPVSGQPGRQ